MLLNGEFVAGAVKRSDGRATPAALHVHRVEKRVQSTRRHANPTGRRGRDPVWRVRNKGATRV